MALFLSRIPTATLRGNQHDSIRKNPLDTFSSRTRHHVHTSLYQCRYSTDSKSLISDCTSAANTARVQLVWLMSNDNKKPRAWACDSKPPPTHPVHWHIRSVVDAVQWRRQWSWCVAVYRQRGPVEHITKGLKKKRRDKWAMDGHRKKGEVCITCQINVVFLIKWKRRKHERTPGWAQWRSEDICFRRGRRKTVFLKHRIAPGAVVAQGCFLVVVVVFSKSCDKKIFECYVHRKQCPLPAYLFHPNSPVCVLGSCWWYRSRRYLMVLWWKNALILPDDIYSTAHM